LDNRIDKHIDDLVGVFTDSIIVFPGGWQNDIPEWIKERITLERLIMNMRVLKGEKPTGTDAEALAYIMPASLEFPLDGDWTQIYLYIATKVCSAAGKEVPGDIRVESLNDYQMGILNHLKQWLYEHRIKVRLERRRAAKREAKEIERAKAPVQLGLGF